MSCNNCKPDWKCNQGRCIVDEKIIGQANSLYGSAGMIPRQQLSLPGRLTLDEWLQRRMPSDNMGFALALAIVGGIMIGVLVAHAWARMV
jgi:hypothetical protein